MFDRDGRLIAHRSVVRVLGPGSASQPSSSAIRPSKVVGVLQDLQKKPPKFNPQQFLEALYEAYLDLTSSDTEGRLKLGESKVTSPHTGHSLISLQQWKDPDAVSLPTRNVYLDGLVKDVHQVRRASNGELGTICRCQTHSTLCQRNGTRPRRLPNICVYPIPLLEWLTGVNRRVSNVGQSTSGVKRDGSPHTSSVKRGQGDFAR